MKYFAFLLLCLATLKIHAQGAQEMVKQRAQQQRDLNNQQQGVTGPAPSAPAAPGYVTPPTVTTPSISPTQQVLLDKVGTDFTVVKSGGSLTDAQKQTLQADLTNLSKSATKPTKAQMAKLAQDLSTALADKQLSSGALAVVANNLNFVMNSASMTATRAQNFATTICSTLKNSGATDAHADAVNCDLKAIIMQIQNNKPKLYQ